MAAELGIVVGEGASTTITGYVAEPESLGKHVLVGTDRIGLISKSIATARALSNIKNFNEAQKATQIPLNTTRDRCYEVTIEIVGNVEDLLNGRIQIPSNPIVPGTSITEVNEKILQEIFGKESDSHIQLGVLKNTPNVPVSVNFEKSCSTHAFFVGMSGMSKTTMATHYIRELNTKGATVVIFDYAGEYDLGIYEIRKVG